MPINTFPGFPMGSGVDSLSSATYLCSVQPPQYIKHIPVLSSCLHLKCLSVSVPLLIFFFLSRSDSKLTCSCEHCQGSPAKAPEPHNTEIRYRVVWLCVRYWVPLPPHVLDWQLSTHGRSTVSTLPVPSGPDLLSSCPAEESADCGQLGPTVPLLIGSQGGRDWLLALGQGPFFLHTPNRRHPFARDVEIPLTSGGTFPAEISPWILNCYMWYV